MNHKPGTFIMLLGDSFKLLMRKDPLNLAGATAFFATFALPPILITMLQILRLVLNPGESNRALFDKLSRMVGEQSATQILRTLEGFSKVADKWWIAVGGFLFLLFVGTTLFKVIKNSLNHVWGVVVVGERSFIEKINPRLKALMVICAAGILFLIVVFAEGLQALVGETFRADSPVAALFFNRVISFLISVVISTAWFALIFILLPDAHLPTRIGILGALFTAVLFSLGKWLIRWLLLRGDFNSIFGASTSLVLLLLFVFYSSFIFYYGAAFTRLCAEYYHRPVKPYKYAELAEL